MSPAVRSRRTVVAAGVVWLGALVAALAVGSQPLPLADLLAGDPVASTVLFDLRLPRALLALVAGGVLATAGAGFQALFRNPLAEPYTLGVASGAALGAVLALQVAPHGWAFGAPLVYAASFLGALAVTALIVGLSTTRAADSSGTLLLAGIAISLSSSALILFIQYLADFHRTFRMVRWMMGGLSVVGFGELLWAAPWALLGMGVLLAHRRELDLLLTGEELAASRGVDLARLRWTTLGATSAMVGALVAVAGPIGFVGLVVPHVLRRWTGHDHAYLLPACFLGGGAFLALCDLAARRVLAPAELPVGVLTALTGGPFFLWLLLRRRLR